MKKLTHAAVGIASLVLSAAAHADPASIAVAAINQEWSRLGSARLQQTACPDRINPDDMNASVVSADVLRVSATTQAVLVNAEPCNGGNQAIQKLVIVEPARAYVVLEREIYDMNFLASSMHLNGTTIELSGYKWIESDDGQLDAHCCPSRHATLYYDVVAGTHKMKLLGRVHTQFDATTATSYASYEKSAEASAVGTIASVGGVSALFICLLAAYFFPTIIAVCRRHHNAAAILLTNLFFGWSGFGWLVSLIWAATAVRKGV